MPNARIYNINPVSRTKSIFPTARTSSRVSYSADRIYPAGMPVGLLLTITRGVKQMLPSVRDVTTPSVRIMKGI